MNISDLAQFGVAGLAVWTMYKIVSNHINHNTAAFEKLSETLQELIIFLKSNK